MFRRFVLLSLVLLSLVLLSLVQASLAPAWAEDPLPFTLPVPDGWRTETIPLPLEFAPEVDYEGLEELRFAPGMFDADAEDFWTYAFLWWVPRDTALTPERLGADLEAYFRGLSLAVAEANGFTLDEPTYEARLREVSDDANRRFDGEVTTFDPFATRGPVRLVVRVEVLPCPEQEHVAVFFELSPQPASHELWRILGEMRRGFRCEPASETSEP